MAIFDGQVATDQGGVASFTTFVGEVEPRVRRALSVAFGAEAGMEATADAFVYAWEHWQRVAEMGNPAGYIYKVGRSKARSRRRPPLVLPPPSSQRMPWIEPGLPNALAALTELQRVCVWLVHGYEWTVTETAELMGISVSSVRKHIERAEKKLQRSLGVKS
jgi:RNA polymerase sigma factor (sigma-70 family)